VPEGHEVNSRGQRPRSSEVLISDTERVAVSTNDIRHLNLYCARCDPFRVGAIHQFPAALPPAIDCVPFRDDSSRFKGRLECF
jgi:hypothetical protein